MRKIFDLFLFLLSIWLLLMWNGNQLKIEFLIAGLISSFLVAVLSFVLGLINQESKMLFLSISFYGHFIRLYFVNFWKSLGLIFDLAIGARFIHPITQNVLIFEKYQPDHALLIASINMMSGLMVVGIVENQLKIYAIDEECFDGLDMLKTSISLQEINDDDLV